MTSNQPPRLESVRPSEQRVAPPRAPAGARRPPQKRPVRHLEQRTAGSRWMRALAWTFGGFLLAIGAGVGMLALFAPVDLVREHLVQQVKAKTGRDLTIAGATSLSFYPNISIAMSNVALSAPPGMAGPPTLRTERLEASVALWPLLSRRIELSRLQLHKPVLDARTDASGRTSWTFAAANDATDMLPTRRIRLAQAATGPGAGKFAPAELKEFMKSASPNSREVTGSRGPLAGLEGLSLADVRIIDGRIDITDERNGRKEQVSALNTTLAMPSLAHALDTRGDLVWRREKLSFNARLTTLKGLTEQRPAVLALNITGRPGNLSYDGNVKFGVTADLDGKISAKAASLPELARWLEAAIPATAGNSVALSGQLTTSGNVVALADAALALDDTKATGNLSVEMRAARPLVKANLHLSEINLNKLVLNGGAPPRPVKPAAGPAPATQPPAGDAARSIEDLLRRPIVEGVPKTVPQVRGFTQSAGWSEEPIDLAAFGLIDADAKLSTDRLLYRDMKIGVTRLTVALKDRVLKATFDDVQLYEGRGRGLITIDGSGKAASIAANLSVDGVSALPLLKDHSGFDWVAGRGKLSVAAAGQGMTQRQIVETTNGRADFTFNDGAIVGFNVAQILRGLQQGRFSGFERVASEKTDFSELAASFQIVNGIAQNNDLRLTSPLVRLTGAGKVNLPARTIDYVAKPKLVANLSGQGGGLNLAGLEVPLKVTGPWDKPQVTPDLDGVLKNPEAATQAVKEIGRQLKGRDANEIVRGLLGNGPDGQPVKPRDALKQLLGR